MKTLLFIVLMALSNNVFASDCKESTTDNTVTDYLKIDTSTPSWLKGATIIVTTADGRTSVVPAEKFKVVPRKQQFLVTKTEKQTTLTCNNIPKNRLSVLGGYGTQSGLKSTSTGSLSEVETNVGLVAGAQYQRVLPLLDDKLNVGVQAQTNKTYSLTVGVDF